MAIDVKPICSADPNFYDVLALGVVRGISQVMLRRKPKPSTAFRDLPRTTLMPNRAR